MNKEESKKRIIKLREEINRHNYLYHVLDQPEISDGALDSLKNELVKLEQEYPEYITKDSPTQRIAGQVLDKFKKVEHHSPMMSMFDAFTEKDILDWENRLLKILNQQKGLEYYAELKMDGLAMSLTYKDGIFYQGATRGDGQTGEDVTNNLKTIESIPLRLRIPKENELKKLGLKQAVVEKVIKLAGRGELELRGEAVMSHKVFEQLNKQYKKAGKKLLANPRNGAAGSIRQLDPKITAERKLEFYVYSIATNFGLEKHEQEHEVAKLLGFKILAQNKFCKDIQEAMHFHDYWEKNKIKLGMDCDGMVLAVNDLSLWKKLGWVGKGPRYMMAYKFSAEQATTKLINIHWQIGRTGVLTPTAVLEPVRICGVTVSRCTLHNLDEINRLGLKIGDTVIIERAGDVIPKVIKVITSLRTGKEKKVIPPKNCEICGGPVSQKNGEVALRCENKDCYAVNLQRLSHWASKNAVDIPGLGPKIVEQLVKIGLVRDVGDFYNLKKGDLLQLEGFAGKAADNLLQAINNKKTIKLPRFIFGLGIHHVGEETAILLAKHFKIKGNKVSDLLNTFSKIKLEELEKLPDIGPIVAKSIYNWFHDEHNISLLKKLDSAKINIEVSKTSNAKLIGRTFVLTGTLPNISRDQAKEMIRNLGGEVSGSVSKNVDYLLLGDNPGSKYEKAKKLGVKMIDEKEFLKMVK
ncbi:MAG: NAD-dependent DNA ligase LigA [bacterium]